MSRLDLDEKLFVRRVASIARKDKDTIRDVMLALLKMATIELYGGAETIVIPYICRLKVIRKEIQTYKGPDYEVTLEATPNRSFVEEYRAIHENRTTPTEKYIRRQIDNKFLELLKLDHLVDISEEESND